MIHPRRSDVAQAARYADSWLAFRQRFNRVPGIQAALVFGEELVLSSAHGHADVEAGVELTTRHLFRIASHSKMFTATAVLQLVERGLLRLDDPIGQLLPFLADAPLGTVTVRDLLGHGGGVIRDGRDADFWQLTRPFPDEVVVRTTSLDRADIMPANTRFKYSNVGYGLLGMIIAAASGRTYAAQLRETIVGPLRLENTGPDYDPARAEEFATGYSGLSYAERRLPLAQGETGAFAPATGFFSTAEDAVRFAAAHFHGDDRLLSDASKRRLQRTEWDVGGGDDQYGLGFAIKDIGGRRVLGHGGGYPGHLTRTWFDPVDRLAVAVLTNAIDGPADVLATGVVRMVNLAMAARPGDARRLDVDLSRFTGRFTNIWRPFDVAELGGRLYMLDPTADDPARQPAPLDVVDATTLRVTGGTGFAAIGELVEYTFADGHVCSLTGNGMTAHPLERFSAAAAARDRITLGAPVL